MGDLIEYATRNDCFVNMSDVLLHELAKNIQHKVRETQKLYQEVQAAQAIDDDAHSKRASDRQTEIEKSGYVLDAMLEDFLAYTSRRHDNIGAILNADKVMHRVFNDSGKVLDVVAKVDCDAGVGKWALGDCKFEMGRECSLFADENRFSREVHEKFENVQRLLGADNEQFFGKRYILVSSERRSAATMKLRNLTLAGRASADYEIVTVRNAERVMSNLSNQK